MLAANRPLSRKITKTERLGDALYLYSDFGTTMLEPRSDRIVRVVTTPAGNPDDGRSAGTDDTSRICRDSDKPGVIDHNAYSEWEWSEDGGSIELKLPALRISVSREAGAKEYYDVDGRLLFRERAEDPVEFEEFETYRLADTKQKTRIVQTADGQKEILEEPEKVSTGHSFHIRFNFELGGGKRAESGAGCTDSDCFDEALYGLGQQEKGYASLRGHTVYIHQANRKIAVPMFVSTRGYGILTDAYSPMIFSDNDLGTYLYIEAARELDYYFIADDMNGVIAGYRKLTGKASLLPKWAFGYVQSQERYESQEEILDTVSRSREAGIGMDCIVLDWMSWPDGEWGQKSYDPVRFPEPKQMIDRLHDEHVHFMISLWPTMAAGTKDHEQFAKRHLFLPACNVYDAFKPEARKLFFDQLKATHFAYGTDAWWCDSSEPFTPEWSHSMRVEEGVLYHAYCEEAGLRMPYEYSNAYPLYHAMGIYENQRLSMESDGHDIPEKRVLNLTRSAYTGQQRYGTVMWSGDTDASWDTYRDQIAIGLHFSASGLPFWTMDIGAFFVKQGEHWYWNGRYDDTLDNPGYCELYTRWYQFAAFLPMFRAHGTDCRREMWGFEGEFYDALLAANRLRYSLMPYIYSEAGKVWLEDRSMIRYLAFDHADDRRTWDITDQFMFGESLMVCPVTEPMYYNEDGKPIADADRSRRVYFPSGCDWYDFHTGIRYEGGSEAEIDAPLERIPLFVRAGSLIPMRAPALSTEELTDDIVFKRFSDGAASYRLYDDDGDGYAYERGEYTVTRYE